MRDGQCLANYRLSAELTAIQTTTDGRCVVIGTLDGCLTVLAIADPLSEASYPFLTSLPSRRFQVSHSYFTTALRVTCNRSCNTYRNINVLPRIRQILNMKYTKVQLKLLLHLLI